MSASETLRVNLESAGIKYGYLGGYYTNVATGDVMWVMRDNYDGTLSIDLGGNYTPDEVVAIITGHRESAAKRNVYYGDGVGHSECTACGRTVSIGSSYCQWCGVRFDGTVSEEG
jgi:hypothetical protein